MLKDKIPNHQLEIVKKKAGDKILNMEVPIKADNLIEGEWTLSKEDRDAALQFMFGLDTKSINKILEDFKPSDNFMEAFRKASPHEINILQPGLIDIKLLSTNIFNLISINETRSDKIILKSDKGHPVLDKNNKPVYVEKNIGDIILSTNKSNFNGFIDSYNLAFTEEKLNNPYINNLFTKIISMAVDRNFDMDLFYNNDIKLYISSKPEDILNMSISKYYDSCQNLYTGSYNSQLIPNIFDKNMKIAFLKFDVPFVDVNKNVVPFTIFSRCIIRNIRGQVYFDNVYPGQLNKLFHAIIEKYSGMKPEYKGNRYYFTDVGLGVPYMDTLKNPVGIKFNSAATNDIRLLSLATFLGEAPEYILNISNKNTLENLYASEKGVYQVLTIDEATKRALAYISEEMIYKQNVYKSYVDVQKFYDENKDKLLKKYEGEIDFDSIAVWAAEPPTPSKKYGVKPSKYGNAKANITIHNLYRLMKPYIDSKFFDERLTPEKIDIKRSKLGEDGIENCLENGFMAYLQKDKYHQNDYQVDFDDDDNDEDDND